MGRRYSRIQFWGGGDASSEVSRVIVGVLAWLDGLRMVTPAGERTNSIDAALGVLQQRAFYVLIDVLLRSEPAYSLDVGS